MTVFELKSNPLVLASIILTCSTGVIFSGSESDFDSLLLLCSSSLSFLIESGSLKCFYGVFLFIKELSFYFDLIKIIFETLMNSERTKAMFTNIRVITIRIKEYPA
jgi:hypothetical protein